MTMKLKEENAAVLSENLEQALEETLASEADSVFFELKGDGSVVAHETWDGGAEL